MSDAPKALDDQTAEEILDSLEQPAGEDTAGPETGDAADVEINDADVPSGPDFSFMEEPTAERLQKLLAGEGLEPEEVENLVSELSSGYMRNKKFTEHRQRDADMVRKAQAVLDKAEQWDKLTADEEYKRYVLAYDGQNGRDSEDKKDLWDMTGQEATTYIESIAERAARRARQEAIEEMQRPQQHIQQLGMALHEWCNERNLTEAQMQVVHEAGQAIVADFGVDNTSPEMLKRALPRYVELIVGRKTQEANKHKQQSTKRKADRARTASPPGGVGAANAEAPDLDARIDAKRKELGRDLKEHELNDLLFDEFAADLGASELELDQVVKKQHNRAAFKPR